MKDQFLNIYNDKITRKGADKLLEWLGSTDFFEAPASTRFHLSRDGGLCEHSIHVFERLKTLVGVEELNNPMFNAPNMESVAIVGLLHDLCKVGVYKQEPKNQKTYDLEKVAAARDGKPWTVKHDSLGDFIWETVRGYKADDQLPYGHGEKSVYIVSGFMKLTRDEAMAIRWHMGFTDNDFRGGGQSVGKAFEMYPLAVLTHLADMKATYLLEG